MGLTVEERLFGLNRQIPGQKKWVSLNSHETLMLNNVNIILDWFLKFPKVPMVVFLDLHVQAVKLPYLIYLYRAGQHILTPIVPGDVSSEDLVSATSRSEDSLHQSLPGGRPTL